MNIEMIFRIIRYNSKIQDIINKLDEQELVNNYFFIQLFNEWNDACKERMNKYLLEETRKSQ